MIFNNKKGNLLPEDLGDWIVPTIVGFALGALACYFTYKGMIPDFFKLF